MSSYGFDQLRSIRGKIIQYFKYLKRIEDIKWHFKPLITESIVNDIVNPESVNQFKNKYNYHIKTAMCI